MIKQISSRVQAMKCDVPDCKREILYPASFRRDEIEQRSSYGFVYEATGDLCKDCIRKMRGIKK